MTGLFQYTLAVSLPLVILWTVYRVAFASGRRFGGNRRLLLGSYAVSYAMFPAVMILRSTRGGISEGGKTLVSGSVDRLLDYLGIMSWIWLAGVMVVLLLTLYECVRIGLVIRHSRMEISCGHKIWVTDDSRIMPFSFGRYIVMNTADYADGRDLIVAHELAHAGYRHTWDMLLAQLTAILCWYNPVAWLMRSELKTIHEYQADRAVMTAGYEAAVYQKFLLGKTLGSRFPYLGNNINYGTLRKRISMMNAGTSVSRHPTWRYVFPIVGIVVASVVMCLPPVTRTLTHVRTADTWASSLKTVHTYVDGVEISGDHLNDIPLNEIKSITVNRQDNRIDIFTK